EHQPDVLLVQETKVSPEAFPHLPFQAAGYTAADHSGGRWEGVAVLVRDGRRISSVQAGLADEPSPGQARWVEAVVDGITFVSVYVPNGRAVGSEPFLEKLRFLEAMAARAPVLGSRAIIGGDMNVCPTDLDVWNPA